MGGLSNAEFLPLTLVLNGAELLPSRFSGNYWSSFCCPVDSGCGVWTKVAARIEWARTRDARHSALSVGLSYDPISLNVSLNSRVGKHILTII